MMYGAAGRDNTYSLSLSRRHEAEVWFAGKVVGEGWNWTSSRSGPGGTVADDRVDGIVEGWSVLVLPGLRITAQWG